MAKADPALRKIWGDRLDQWSKSHKSVAGWCKEQGIAVHLFWYWRKKLRSKANGLKSSSNTFLEIVDNPKDPGLTLECNGVRVSLTKDFDMEVLVHCLRALRRL